MIRTFRTHNIRKQQELTGRYWEFSACSGEYAGEKFNVLTPCCWEITSVINNANTFAIMSFLIKKPPLNFRYY